MLFVRTNMYIVLVYCTSINNHVLILTLQYYCCNELIVIKIKYARKVCPSRRKQWYSNYV